MSDAATAIAVTGLSKFYEKSNFEITDLSLAIRQGETFCIVGSNSAGKTTLLRCILGLEDFTSGSVKIFDGNRMTTIDASERRICADTRKKVGFISQELALWPHWSVVENVIGPLRDVHDVGQEAAKVKAEELLRKLNVEEKYWNEFPSKLSAGKQRAVTVARTLATEPDILIVDEIETYLDGRVLGNILKVIEDDYVRKPQKTVVLVTHKIELLTRYATRVAILADGNIVDIGPADRVLTAPTPKAAEFISELTSPARSDWSLGHQCLKKALAISSLVLHANDGVSPLLQVATELSDFLKMLYPRDEHFVWVVTSDIQNRNPFKTRGAVKSEGFQLDGADVLRLGPLVQGKTTRKQDGNKTIEETKYDLVKDYKELCKSPQGAQFTCDEGDGEKQSLIAWVLTGMASSAGDIQYTYDDGRDSIPGAYNYDVEKPGNAIAKRFYIELSKQTKRVHLFPMVWEQNSVGVICIDTYSPEKWGPPVVDHFKLLAIWCALIVQRALQDENSKGSSSNQ